MARAYVAYRAPCASHQHPPRRCPGRRRDGRQITYMRCTYHVTALFSLAVLRPPPPVVERYSRSAASCCFLGPVWVVVSIRAPADLPSALCTKAGARIVLSPLRSRSAVASSCEYFAPVRHRSALLAPLVTSSEAQPLSSLFAHPSRGLFAQHSVFYAFPLFARRAQGPTLLPRHATTRQTTRSLPETSRYTSRTGP